MTLQNQDNITRQKLQALKELPTEFSFDALNIWQQLETELQPKKQRKKYLVWTSVAAILLLVTLTAVIFLSQDSKQEETSIAKKPEVAIPVTDEPKKEVVKVKRIQPQLSLSAKIKFPTKKVELNTEVIHDSVPHQQIAIKTIEPTNLKNIVPQIAVVTIQEPASIVKKPRLKVIHLNDLYKSSAEESIKTEIARKQIAEEQESDPITPTTPSKTFWKAKAPQKITATLNDNP